MMNQRLSLVLTLTTEDSEGLASLRDCLAVGFSFVYAIHKEVKWPPKAMILSYFLFYVCFSY